MNNQKLISAIRRTGRSRGYSRRGRSGRGVFRRQKRMVRRAMKSMSELKYVVSNVNYAGQISSTVVNELGGTVIEVPMSITQGPGKVGQRIGNMIQYKFITARCMLQMAWNGQDLSYTTPAFFVRVIFFQKRLPVTDANQVIDIGGTNTAAELVSTNVIMAPTNNQNVRVLNDDVYVLNNGAGTDHQYGSCSPAGVSFTYRHKVNNHVSFRGATVTTPTDPTDQYGFLIFMRGIQGPYEATTDVGRTAVYFRSIVKTSYYDM